MNLSTIFPTTGPGPDLSSDITPFIVMGVCLLVMAVVGIVGNVFVILAVMFSRKLQTVANALVVNLSVANLLTSLANIVWGSYILGIVSLSYWVSLMSGTVEDISRGCSYATIVLIAVNRYIKITKMMHTYDRIFSPVSMFVMIMLAWLCPSAAILVIYCSLEKNWYVIYLAPSTLVVTIVIVLVCYGLIVVHIKRHVAEMAELSVTRNSPRRLDIAVTKNLFCVVCAFYICVIPAVLLFVVPFFIELDEVLITTITTLEFLLRLDSIVNPIIYALRHPVFKPVFYHMITCSWSQIPQPSRILKTLISTRACSHADENEQASTSSRGGTCESDVL